jgi:O-acetyl-ADP-ribose deacetylase (regulator of RNase III)
MKKEELLNTLLKYLINENKNVQIQDIPTDYIEKRKLLRALMNIQEPNPLNPDILKIQDEFLSEEKKEIKIVNPYNLATVSEEFKSTKIHFSEKLILWKGDITAIEADAIVNAANSKLLGCFVPLHRCIDNAIHSASGIQLRLKCNEIMERQGFDEPMGCAKITKAYNLPSKYVLHTVGPIIHSTVTEKDCKLLASCYTSCLHKAKEYREIKTIAFCSISTGEFRFPKDTASKIAVSTVCKFLDLNKDRFDRIIFNVFTEEDYETYAKLFR